MLSEIRLTEQDSVSLLAALQGVVRQRVARQVDGRSAEGLGSELERDVAESRDGLEDSDGFAGDFGACALESEGMDASYRARRGLRG